MLLYFHLVIINMSECFLFCVAHQEEYHERRSHKAAILCSLSTYHVAGGHHLHFLYLFQFLQLKELVLLLDYL